jgi:hypothetical protein
MNEWRKNAVWYLEVVMSVAIAYNKVKLLNDNPPSPSSYNILFTYIQ